MPYTPPATYIIELTFDDRQAAEKAYDRLEQSNWLMNLGGHLSMRFVPVVTPDVADDDE